MDILVAGDHADVARELVLRGDAAVDLYVGAEALWDEGSVEHDADGVPHQRAVSDGREEARGEGGALEACGADKRGGADGDQSNKELDAEGPGLGAVELGAAVEVYAECAEERGGAHEGAHGAGVAVQGGELRGEDGCGDEDGDAAVVDAREPAAEPQERGAVEGVPEGGGEETLDGGEQEHECDALGERGDLVGLVDLRRGELVQGDVGHVHCAKEVCPDVGGLVVPAVPVHDGEERLLVGVVEAVVVDDVPVLSPGKWQLVVVQVRGGAECVGALVAVAANALSNRNVRAVVDIDVAGLLLAHVQLAHLLLQLLADLAILVLGVQQGGGTAGARELAGHVRVRV